MWRYIEIVLVVGILLFTVNAHAETSAGELELSNGNNPNKLAVLLTTEVSGNVNGVIASLTVKQTFQNNIDDWVNGRYVFPLPEGAAVDSFRMQIGERVINGLIKEKEQAEKEFQAAKISGKKAGMLKQHRPNLFSISVANIGPHEEIVTELTFVDKIHFEDNTFSLTLPTTITPRYIPNATINNQTPQEIERALDQTISESIKEQENINTNLVSGWASNNSRVVDANDITPPQSHSVGNQRSHTFSLALSVNAGLNLESVTSQTHKITSHYSTNHNVDVTLANNVEKMDSDLVLEWRAVSGETPQAAFFQQKFDDAYYSMLMVTPPQINTNLSLPRDVTFVIDTSGSMSGVSIRQAKQALHTGLDYLSVNDKFNVIEFNSDFTSLFVKSKPVTNATLNQAHTMINGLHADGGTEMLDPLKHAFESKKDSTYLSQVIFITDGSIGNESELFNMIKNNIKDTRLFTVGIGSAPNTFFMNKASQFGRGTNTTINNLNQVKDKMAKLFKKITSPIMRNIVITWPQAGSAEAYPNKVPDLYSGEPLTVIVKSKNPITKAQIEGKLINTPWQKSLSLIQSNTLQTDNLDTVWARQKVAALMDELRIGARTNLQTKSDVVALGIEHNIVTKYTSFIAVENTPSKLNEEIAKEKAIPNLMPQGITMPAPQTATPSTLLVLLGTLLVLLSYGIRRREPTLKHPFRSLNLRKTILRA